MTTAVHFEVKGLRELDAVLKDLGPAAANRVARSALNRSATPVVAKAKQLVPVDTGELRDAISKRLRRHRQGSATQTILIGIEKPTSRRAHFIEFGTRHQAAQSFLRASLDESVAEVLQIQKDAMRIGIDREAKKLAARHGSLRTK